MNRMNKEKFLSRTKADANGCLIWQGAIKKSQAGAHGYGWVTFMNRQMHSHRLAWILFRGDIPHGQYVCHSCDVPACVNPDHLFLGTPGDNMRDMWSKGRHTLPRGNVYAAKIGIEELKAIRALLLSGMSQRAIGALYGITQSAVSRIATGKNWSGHV